MGDGHFRGDQLQVGIPVGAQGFQSLGNAGPIQPRCHPHHNRGAHGTKGYRRALHHHAQHDRGHGRKAHRNQQGRGDGRRCTEARRTFNKAAEQPDNDDGLNTAIRGDVGKASPNRGDGTGMFQGVQQQYRAEDYPQQANRNHQPLQGGGEDTVQGHIPGAVADQRGDQKYHGHGMAGGPTHANQQHSSQENGRKRQ